MKKLYLALAGLVLCSGAFGQNLNGIQDNGIKHPCLSPYVRTAQQHQVIDGSRSKQINYWIDPIVDMMWNKGVKIDDPYYKAPFDEIISLAPLFMDSTVTVSDPDTTQPVYYNEIGNVLDMHSLYLESNPDGSPSGGNAEPIFTKTDAFNIDSVAIWGSYVRVNKTQDDTLDVYLVWGDSTDASVFTKRKGTSLWLAPVGTWKTNLFAPTVKGASTADGNVITANAAPANMIHVKRVLTAADTSKGLGYSRSIRVFLNAKIPAGKIVSCFYTFVPASTGHVKGRCFYKFDASLVPQQENGFAACVWEQKTPKIVAVADYKPYQIDLTPGCASTGTQMTVEGRYKIYSSLQNSLIGNPATATYLQYKITGTSTIGIKEFNNDFSLSQNAPNPFTNETTIAYQLKTAAKSVSLVIYDVAGVKLFDKVQTNLGAGKYTVEVNNTNFASGIYFYSLIVDGNQITKKMVVTE